jgi:RNase P subunit RPR2
MACENCDYKALDPNGQKVLDDGRAYISFTCPKCLTIKRYWCIGGMSQEQIERTNKEENFAGGKYSG